MAASATLSLRRVGRAALVCVGYWVLACVASAADDPLPSWNASAAKQAIVDFVERVTREGGSDFVRQEDRVATFDNDGTLWCEQPLYFQLVFAMDRVKALAPQHPEWKDTEPFKSILAGNAKSVLAGGDRRTADRSIGEIMSATHAGMTTGAFDDAVRQWLAAARHPRFQRPYNRLVYQPMIELLEYLRSRGFRTFIVSGGGADFMRVWTQDAYGVPPDQVVGTTGKLKYEVRDGRPELIKLAAIELVDDGPGKPAGIHQFIGQQPILAFGNSDGDFEMLQYTTLAAAGPRLGLLLHHTDAEREYAYDRDSLVGRLQRGLDEAPRYGWVVVDMKADWRTVFAP